MRMAAEETLPVAAEASEQRGAVTVGTTMPHSEDAEMYLGSLRDFSRTDARGMWSLAVSEVGASDNLDAHGALYVHPAMEADFSVGLDADVNWWYLCKIHKVRSM